MSTKKSWIERKWRACLFLLAALICAVVAVMGWHWTTTARTPFWWTFWVVAAILAIPAFIGLIVWLNNARKKW